MDFGTIATAFSTVKSMKELAGALLNAKVDAETKAQISEFVEKLGGVQENLFYAREELIKVQEEKQVLKKQVEELQQELEMKGKVQYIEPFCWKVDGEKKDGPLCQRCWETRGLLVHLQGGKNDVWRCYECKSKYFGPTYKAGRSYVIH